MILYLETNFLMAVVTGRENRFEELFSLREDSLRILIPDVCIMEAFSVLEKERARRNRFRVTLDNEINALQRDQTSSHATNLLKALETETARIENDNVFNDIAQRLHNIVEIVVGPTSPLRSAELLPLTANIRNNSLVPPAVPNQPTDSLIIAILTEHAQRDPDPDKIFLSENTRDFDSDKFPEMREHFQTLKVNFLPTLDAFLGRYNAAARNSS